MVIMCDEIEIEEHDVLDKPSVKMDEIDIEEHDVLDKHWVKTDEIDIEENLNLDKPMVIMNEMNIEEHDILNKPMSKMDEIDIEEHDILDNPLIKKLFPDLSVLKQEMDEYDEEALIISPESMLEETSQAEIIENTQDMKKQLYNHIQNSSQLATHSHVETETTQERYLHENIIILGSRPSLKNKVVKTIKKEPKLILNDVNIFLNKSRRYCKECFILFPKAYLLNFHMFNLHKKRNNQSVGIKITDKLYKCNTCGNCLSSKANLFRHFRNLHGVDTNMETEKIDATTDKEIISKDNAQYTKSVNMTCFHCQKMFSTQSSLIEHLYEVLKPNKGEPDDRPSSSATTKDIYKDNQLIDQVKCNISNTESILPCHVEGSLPNNNVVEIVDSDKENDENKKKLIANANTLQNGKTKAKKMKCNIHIEKFDGIRKIKYHTRSIDRKNKKIINKAKIVNTRQEKNKFYKCFICSKYNVTFQFYSRHLMTDHYIKEVTGARKVPFVSQCIFCPSKSSSIKSYNAHLYKYHKKKLKGLDQTVNNNLNEEIKFVFKSVLFNCTKCDLFFLTSKAAMDHSKHLETSNTWECSICQRMFNNDDMKLHEKQHTFSETFTVHTPTDCASSQVLYKCSNCTIHYGENNFILHFFKCDSETPHSIYCKICDILINTDDMKCHEINHKEKESRYCDFIIIESDMIDDRCINQNKYETNSSTVTIKNTDEDMKLDKTTSSTDYKRSKGFKNKSKLPMHYCVTCKSFLFNYIINYTHNIHTDGKCSHVVKTVCTDCGLVMTTKSHWTHKKHHHNKKMSIHDYLFYDLKSKKRIHPPVPEYPKCNMCGIHFLNNLSIKTHPCGEQDYFTCNICSIKLSERAYKLHMQFHSYPIQSECTKPGNLGLNLHSGVDTSCEQLKPDSRVSLGNYSAEEIILYTCKGCQLTVDTYDKVVRHCQDHYDSETIKLKMQKCQNCILTFHHNEYDSHNMLHISGKYNKDLNINVEFDPFYFPFYNGFWTKHIFAYVADEFMTNILNSSIYRYECRLKMNVIQPGSSDLTHYKCDKCQVFVDPHLLYMHAINSAEKIPCDKLKKHRCAFCGLLFSSFTYRVRHTKEHENIDTKTSVESYRIILFNKMNHEPYTKSIHAASDRYILYQCRNCESVVDKFERNTHQCDRNNLKICSICGLLLHKRDFDLHFIRHEELNKFNTENMIVIMFGKLSYRGKNELKSTFSGTKCDYTAYKCKNCDLCMLTKKSTFEHVCIFDDSKCKCSKCGLYFSKAELKIHDKLHIRNVDFDYLTMDIIPFYRTPKIDHIDILEKNEIGPVQSTTLEVSNNLIVKNTLNNPGSIKYIQEMIYKCDCGLHFLEELNAQEHANICNVRMKISKQSCSKCNLLFTPGDLFNHLLKHHCDKKLQFKFATILVSKK